MLRQLVIGAIILLAGLGASKFIISRKPVPEEKPRTAIVPLVEVVRLDIQSGHLRVKGSGTVRAREELNLSTEVAGKLVYVSPKLREGQQVLAGSTLLRIDPTDYLSAVETAQAAIETRKLEVVQATEEMELAKAELSLFEGRASTGLRYEGADVSAILPPETLSAHALTSSGQHSGQHSGQISGKSSYSGLATGEPQLLAAQANLRSAQLQLDNAKVALKRTTVKAPFSGVVRQEQVALGSYVTPGQNLGSIIGTAAFEAVIPLSEDEAALIPGLWRSKGDPVKAMVSLNYGGTTYEWPAIIDSTSNVLNPQTRTIDVFLKIKDPLKGGKSIQMQGQEERSAPPLFVGSFVKATILGHPLEAYARLPLEALRPGNKVWLVENDKLRSADVEIYQKQDSEALISTQGLGLNPVVVLNPARTATPGQNVRVSMGGEAR